MTDYQIKSYKFRREREGSWQELEALVQKAETDGVRSLSSNELFRLPILYRATMSSLSVARSISLDQNVVAYLESLSARAYFFVYGARAHFFEALAAFFLVRFPAAVRAAKFEILVAGLCLILGVVAGFIATLGNGDWFYTFVSEDYAAGRSPTSSTTDLRNVLYQSGDARTALYNFATFLFTHNAQIGLLSFALGFALGIPVLVLMFYNGSIIGAFAALYAGRGLSPDFWAWLLIHGTTEILAVALCGGAGLVLAGGLVVPGRHTRLDNLARKGRMASQIVLGAVAMFFIAAILEGLGRELITNMTLRYAIALGALAFWGWYLLRSGTRGLDDNSS